MDFCTKVEEELDFLNMSKKELAALSGIKEQTLHKAFERNSIPSAETAVKIARVLNVSVEYLVTGSSSSSKAVSESEAYQIRLYKKYASLIDFLETCSPEQKSAFKLLSEQLLKL